MLLELQEVAIFAKKVNYMDAKMAEDFIRVYYKNIVEKWKNFFLLKKKVRCTQITKRVK